MDTIGVVAAARQSERAATSEGAAASEGAATSARTIAAHVC